MTPQISRRVSGWLFLFANFFLFASNTMDTNFLQLSAGILFLSCSVSVILSAKHHRFMFWWSFAVTVAYILTALSTKGSGDVFAYLSIISGTIAGLLIFRAGLQRETGKQYKLPSLFDVLDKYPLAMAGVIEGACCVLQLVASILNDDIRLLIACVIWVIAHTLLIYSDEFLHARLKVKK